jgi:hypothetical protein
MARAGEGVRAIINALITQVSVSFRRILFIEVLRHETHIPGPDYGWTLDVSDSSPVKGQIGHPGHILGQAPRGKHSAASVKLDDAEWKAIEDDAKQK